MMAAVGNFLAGIFRRAPAASGMGLCPPGGSRGRSGIWQAPAGREQAEHPSRSLRPPRQPLVLILGPSRAAISGVSTHVNLLMDSVLGRQFRLCHFQVGSEGRSEGPAGRALRLLTGPLLLAFTILRRDAAVVHINTSLNRRAFWRDLACLVSARLCGARVLWQVHGGSLPEDFVGGHQLLAPLLRRVLGWPDVVVVLARVELLAYRAFVPGQQVMVLPNGLDMRAYADLPPRRPSPRGQPLRLCYIGRLAPGKGLEEILDAVQRSQARGCELRLVLAGDGVLAPQLQVQVRAMGLQDRVSFPGAVFGEAKLALLRAADAFLLPSHSEGLPYAMMESMAAGVPVIVTAVGAIPDVVRQGVHGCIVPVRDPEAIAQAILMLDANRERLAAMGVACRRRIAGHYSMERLGIGFARTYASLCAGMGAASRPPSGHGGRDRDRLDPS